MAKRKIIIDTDPGIDDALALFLAFSADEWDILGITSVGGNVPAAQTAENALRIAAFAKKNIPVYKGTDTPLYRTPHNAPHVHGVNGLGGVELPPASGKILEGAPGFIYKQAVKAGGELEIIALGPLTNLATAFLTYPDLASMIKKIWIMGGAARGGNATPAAEFNILADPEAAAAVFNSGAPIAMCGLDVTNRALYMPEDLERFGAIGNPVTSVLYQMGRSYMKFYHSFGFPGMGMHDPFAVAWALDPTLATAEKLRVDVELKGKHTYGKTVVDIYKVTGKEPNAEVALELDRDRFVEFFEDRMKRYG
jgi:pyrimidine-specific ribonucleoside hydrolase